ncbi:sodium:calcium antiporter [Halorientalis pallida]|uniref:Sodium:calcium antiporter n=1 Tax=Halorientalis pallida TaxID=2479928 RepID=A0A498KSZ3_9EURY|nr:sodium:calcium antiporter [Halorientalis pallida]RXK46989.1 sodium:calcium antiporter [Halorientalis pallida]
MAVAAVALDLLVVAVAVAALWYGGLRFVDSASTLARRLGVSDLVIGLTVVGFGTSLPEFAVTVDAAVVGRADIAVANVVGSNLLNLGLVLGAVALFGSVAASRTLVRRDGGVVVASTVLGGLVCWDLTVTRLEAGGLFLAFLTYLLVVVVRDSGGEAKREAAGGAMLRTALTAVVGLALIVGGANLLVGAAADLARVAGLSEWVIGETVVAFGTSTPEFVASLAAARRGLGDVAAGNLLGSSVFNLLGVLGLAGLVVPLSVAPAAATSLVWLLGLSALAVVLLATGGGLSRGEGVPLVLVAVAKWVVDLV